MFDGESGGDLAVGDGRAEMRLLKVGEE